MLVLTRRRGETIKINDNISIRVLKVDGNKVRIGVEAPKEMDIYRLEVYERIRKEKGKAA